VLTIRHWRPLLATFSAFLEKSEPKYC